MPGPPTLEGPRDEPVVLRVELRCTGEVPSTADPTLLQCDNGIVHRPAPPSSQLECAECPPAAPILPASLDYCASDADCPTGSLCIASTELGMTPKGCPGTTTGQAFAPLRHYFACQSAEDTCGADSQCPGQQVCAAWNIGRRCSSYITYPCGVPGRPFLVSGAARVADVRPGTDWSGPLLAPPFDLDSPTRSALTGHWLEAALREHASVAAFGRFTLQLLELGAPCELILDSQRAMGDETEHARRCFALASRYAGCVLGPDTLPLAGAMESMSLASIARLTFHEGCVGETCAALEAAEAFAAATDPEVRQTLELIARDERRHAELAWRLVAWALEADATGEVRQMLRRELEALGSRTAATGGTAASPDDSTVEASGLMSHGYMTQTRSRALLQAALSAIVVPCTERLLARHANAVHVTAMATQLERIS